MTEPLPGGVSLCADSRILDLLANGAGRDWKVFPGAEERAEERAAKWADSVSRR